jgi:hypothetical protein
MLVVHLHAKRCHSYVMPLCIDMYAGPLARQAVPGLEEDPGPLCHDEGEAGSRLWA